MSSENAIVLRDVVKTFDGHRAVDGISLAIPRGTIFGLLGPNGAGKSTTIRMILDIIRPDSGEVLLLGAPPGSGTKRRVGYLPEERGLYRKMVVLELLEFLGSIKGAPPASARKEAAAWLEKLGLSDWKTKKAEELSKGMQQKVQFVAAVLGNPELLILDEPFSGMDPVNQNLFKDLLLEINRAGTTVVFSTHQMDTAERLCREIVLIDRGKVVLEGNLAAIKAGFGKNSVMLSFKGDGGFLHTYPGVSRVDEYEGYLEVRLHPGTDPQDLLRLCADRLAVRRFEIVEPSLHNIFLDAVGSTAAVPSARPEGIAHA